MASPSHRRRLGVLFLFLAALFALIAVAAASAGGQFWIVALAGVALALWLASLAVGALRAH